jgi:hypothetical protein
VHLIWLWSLRKRKIEGEMGPEKGSGARWIRKTTMEPDGTTTLLQQQGWRRKIFFRRDGSGSLLEMTFFWSTEIGRSHKGAPLFINAEWVSPGDGLKRVYMQQ